MANLIVVENPKLWPLTIPDTEVVMARAYVTEVAYSELRRAKVFNLCRSSTYQGLGYYVSLLAAARGHRPLPSVTTIQDLRQSAIIRIASEDLQASLQRSLASLRSDRFTLSIYFGRNMARKYDRLCRALFNYFPAPLLRADFVRVDEWRLQALRAIASSDIPESHRPFVIEQAGRFFERPRIRSPRPPRYELAILFDPNEIDSPSDERAITKFTRAAERLGMRVTLLGKEDLGRVGEYDALFIRETTAVDHHTYRFARRAEAEGLVVIDDPESIIKCCNKVYQAELFQRHAIPCPRTMVVHRDNADRIDAMLGLPVVLKRPDSSFSLGVVKAADEASLAGYLDAFFAASELVVAQEFVPSEFDWRIGVLEGRPLFAGRYHMASGHWQIQKAEPGGRRKYGKVSMVPLDEAPAPATRLAVRAARLVGNGLYGVDVKEVDGRFLVMEVNDNPNIEAGYEDTVLKDALYDAVMRVFLDRLERQKRPVTHA